MQRCTRSPKALFWSVALALTTGACASTGATPRPFPMPDRPPRDAADNTRDSPAAAENDQPDKPVRVDPGEQLAQTALDLRGAPYRNGGQDPRGFDCSGFTQYVFAAHGFFLPREVSEQFRLGKLVSPIEVAPGDLIFFAVAGSGASHVAIAIGGDGFVHAPSSRGVVRVEHLSSSYWSQRFVGIRRLTAD